jgi:hypothetical protein
MKSSRQACPQNDLIEVFVKDGYTEKIGNELDRYFDAYEKHYQKIYNVNAELVEKKMAFYEANGFDIQKEKNSYYNESLSDLVKNTSTKERIMEYQGNLIQIINPVFQSPNHAMQWTTGHLFS